MELDRDAGGVTGSWTLLDSNFMTIIVASWKTTSAKWASAMMATFGSTITHDGISLHSTSGRLIYKRRSDMFGVGPST